VDEERSAAASGPRDALDHLRGSRFVDVGYGNACSVTRQTLRDGGAYTPRCTSHQRDFVLRLRHV
jgi:hypothetical protein